MFLRSIPMPFRGAPRRSVLILLAAALAAGCPTDETEPATTDTGFPDILVGTPDSNELDSGEPDTDGSETADVADSDVAGSDVAGPETSGADVPDQDLGAELPDSGPTLLCTPGTSLCDGLTSGQVCMDDGMGWAALSCDAGEVCYLGECQPTICDSADPPWCDDDGQRRVCNGLGTEWTPLPCPGGTVCEEGQCAPIRPNVVLIVDTSTSMNDLYSKPGAAAGSCQGDDCPPWDFPNCDSAEAPWTRLGQVKKALNQLTDGPAADVARLALQRFPQTPSHESGCDHGYWGSLSKISGHGDEPVVPFGVLEESLHQIMIVPFPSDAPGSNLDSIRQWTDFVEGITPTEQACDYDWDCPDNLCEGWPKFCQAMTEPELRAVGSTPLGRSLFYAGEYLRQMVLVEGRSCTVDADCGSPNHRCDAGACHDPHRACRSSAIILFTDGQETSYEDTDEFFNPSVQARRLRFGLSCLGNANCSEGATCVDGLCQPPDGVLPDGLTPLEYEATGTIEAPLGPDGLPRSVLVHVVDASNGGLGTDTNAEIAAHAGGQHVPVDIADLDQLVTELVQLLDIKLPATCE